VSASFLYELHKGKHEDVKMGANVEGRKAIFITGAGSGIGRAVAHKYAEKGWFVGLADVNPKGLSETAEMLPAGQVSSHVMDVRQRTDWEKALEDFWAASGGRLDVLFNNAGVGRGGPIDKVTHEDTDLVIDVNIRGVIHGAEAGFKYLKQTPGSCLLNTASAAGIYGAGGMSIYCASKFAVRGLTESLDIEWAAHGIKVRSLMPGFIDTPILDSIALDSNKQTRDIVREAGLEISPVSLVADAAWDAVHKNAVHTRVGPTAHRAWFLTRWVPGFFRKQALKRGGFAKAD
jgi:NAD(P)-dependent dehydrogenase (short-subunit alcohol dehydrogenase family)